jgi:hypothetical protein
VGIFEEGGQQKGTRGFVAISFSQASFSSFSSGSSVSLHRDVFAPSPLQLLTSSCSRSFGHSLSARCQTLSRCIRHPLDRSTPLPRSIPLSLAMDISINPQGKTSARLDMSNLRSAPLQGSLQAMRRMRPRQHGVMPALRFSERLHSHIGHLPIMSGIPLPIRKCRRHG